MRKLPWYLSTTFIAILFAGWWLYGIPLIVGIILLFVRNKKEKAIKKEWEESGFDNLEEVKSQYEEAEVKLQDVKTTLTSKEQELQQLNKKIEENNELVSKINNFENTISNYNEQIIALTTELSELEETKKRFIDENEKVSLLKDEAVKTEKQLIKHQKLIEKYKVEIEGIKQLVENFPNAINYSYIEQQLQELDNQLEEGYLHTIVELDLHHKASKELRKEMNVNNKLIKKLLKDYQSRYTSKANRTIYDLMVIGLQAELQNILYTLSYTNLDKALNNSKELIEKYLTICGNGNASILPTITRFLAELEPLFRNAIQIEYKYHIQKEKEKEEQKLIKEQMRQEAEERRLLEQERKKIELEGEKYLAEINKNKELLSQEQDQEKILALQLRLTELEEQFSNIEEQKEEILKRANGRAGYVYVISNLGSFGDRTFKIGMTRRLNPLDRIDELGNASVPFRFDIHAMVFSDNAVDLEQKIHNHLEKSRINKVNLRKEFFNIDVFELQEIVQEIDPTVEFTTTMKAEEYRQSLSLVTEELETTL
ncbi:GIY-YIG nuclease family protein [Bacillus sp. FJAT-45066]|uniref:GIY-YIG nuclease family protein n=1 Tax=Bacillus sp. FJAT-45066 TaxID=2011010 RepID=UPI000BB8376C|nr:GIY-YIG nuclease family protein [Bacillus sp. FJAT-45066]